MLVSLSTLQQHCYTLTLPAVSVVVKLFHFIIIIISLKVEELDKELEVRNSRSGRNHHGLSKAEKKEELLNLLRGTTTTINHVQIVLDSTCTL